MSIGLLGQKIGMTSVYDAKGRLRPVTVIAAGDNVLLRRLTEENEGYSAVQVGFGAQKESRVTKALVGEFKKAGVEPKRLMREFRLKNDASRRRDQLERYAISAGRLRRCNRPLERQRLSGRDEEAQLRTGRARRTVRKRTGATARSAIVPRRDAFGRTGYARSHGRRACDRAKSTGHAGARSRKNHFDKRRCARSERQLCDRATGHQTSRTLTGLTC